MHGSVYLCIQIYNNSRDRLLFNFFFFLVHLIQCKIIAQNPLNPLLTTKPYEVEMWVEEIFVMISHQVYQLHAVVTVINVYVSLSFQARLFIR